MEDGVARGYKFCTMAAIHEPLLSRYPILAGRLDVRFDADSAILAAIDAKKCDVGVISEVSFRNAQKGVYTPDTPRQYCNKILVGSPLMSYSNAMPVSVELMLAFSWAVTIGISKGWYVREEEAAIKETMPGDQCSPNELVTSKSIGIMDMVGTATWTTLIVLLGLAVFAVSKLKLLIGREKPVPSIATEAKIEEMAYLPMEDKIEEIAYRVAARLARTAALGASANDAQLGARESLRCCNPFPLCACRFPGQHCSVASAPHASTHVHAPAPRCH